MHPTRSRVERRGRGGAAAGGHVDVARVRRSCRVHRTVGAEPRRAFRITTLLRRRALASHEHHSSARLSLGSRIPAKSHLPWPLSGDDDRFGIYFWLQSCRARRELSGGIFGGAGGQPTNGEPKAGRAPFFQPLSDRLHTYDLGVVGLTTACCMIDLLEYLVTLPSSTRVHYRTKDLSRGCPVCMPHT